MAETKGHAPPDGDGAVAGDWRPRPDPTLLTTQQLNQQIASLKELVFTRLDAMDKALELSQTNLAAVPTEVDKQVSNLKELMTEKFDGIESRFTERDEAVRAAFNAAKEAVGEQNRANSTAIAKSDTAVAKQIDAQGELIRTTTKALEIVLGDLKERLTRIEGEERGEHSGRTTQQTSIGLIIGVIGSAIGVAGFLTLMLRP